MRRSCVIGALASWAVCCTTASPFSSKASSAVGAWTNTTATPCSSTCQSSSLATSTKWPLFWPGHGPQIYPSGSPFPKPQPSSTLDFSTTYRPTRPTITWATQYPSSTDALAHLTPEQKCNYLERMSFDEGWPESARESLDPVVKKFSDAVSTEKITPFDVTRIKEELRKASEELAKIEKAGEELLWVLKFCQHHLGSDELRPTDDVVEVLRSKAEDLEYRQEELEDRTEWLDTLVDDAIRHKELPYGAYGPEHPPPHLPGRIPFSSLFNFPSAVNETSTSIAKRDIEDTDDDSTEKRKCKTEFDPKCTAKWERLITSLAAEIGQEKNQTERMRLEERLQAYELAQFVGCVKPCALHPKHPEHPKHPKHPKYPKHPKHPKLPNQVWTIVNGIIRGVVNLLHLNGGHSHPKHGYHPSPSSHHSTKPTSIPDYCQSLGLSRNETLLCNLMHLPGLLHPKSTQAANHTTTPHHTSLHTTMSTVHTIPVTACTSSAYGTGSSSKMHSILSSSTARSGSAKPHTPTITKVYTSSKPVTSGPVMPHATSKTSLSFKPISSSKPSSHSKPTSSQSHGPVYPVPKPYSTTLVQHTYAAQP